MIFDAKKVLIAGGSGLIGYNTARVFLEKGASVTCVQLPLEEENKKYFDGIDIVEADLFEADEEELISLFKRDDYDLIVYAVSPDFRDVITAPASDYFDMRLRLMSKKILSAAKKAGIRRATVISSFLLYFDEAPDCSGGLSSVHPYVKAVAMQEAEAIRLRDADFDVVFARLPLVFGSLPFEPSKWKSFLLDKLQRGVAVLCPKGGANMISARGAGEGVYACSVNGKSGKKYLIGNKNVSYFDMFSTMFGTIGDKRKIMSAPSWIIACALFFFRIFLKIKKMDIGLDLYKVSKQILNKKLYYDSRDAEQKLGYSELGLNTEDDVMLCIKQMMRYCYPSKFDENGNLKA